MRIAPVLAFSFFTAGCSLINAPDEIRPGGTGASGGTGGQSSCGAPTDCPASEDPCLEPTCEGGVCGTAPAVDGTACGDATATACSAADSCLAGVCDSGDRTGTICNECPDGACTCAAGACTDTCEALSSTNGFHGPWSIGGWTLSEGWAIRRGAVPTGLNSGPITFTGNVLGADGFEFVPYGHTYPYQLGVETAQTPAITMPANFTFRSWHIDSGSGTDKSVRVSTDGGATWTVLIDCATVPTPIICQPVSNRTATAWDTVSINVPAQFVGMSALVEFHYETYFQNDGTDRGWYIDDVGLGTSCRCTADAECASYDNACGKGRCDTGTGECRMAAEHTGDACGDATANDCTAADTCDATGLCASNHSSDRTTCLDCPDENACKKICSQGACLACPTTQPFTSPDFSAFTYSVPPSGADNDWGFRTTLPPNSLSGTESFPVERGTALGTDGVRAVPYPGDNRESGSVTFGAGALPAQITFESWHQDEAFRNKILEVSVDNGVTWTKLIDCVDGPSTAKFCPAWPFPTTNRAVTEWDDESIAVPQALQGKVALIRFSYESFGMGAAWERGFYIDNLNVGTCHYVP